MSTKNERQKYVLDNLGTYWDFLNEVLFGPFSDRDKMEFSAISANTAMDGAIDGFLATRDKESVTEIAEALLFWGVNAPFKKAAYCMGIRECDASLIPNPDIDMQVQREQCVPHVKGLGYAKYSFAASMIAPMESTIVCLDTWMVQALIEKIPNTKGEPDSFIYGTSKRVLERYLSIEKIILDEAKEIDVPPFLFQWAVWDMIRATANKPKETHSFLWNKGREHYQLTMNEIGISI